MSAIPKFIYISFIYFISSLFPLFNLAGDSERCSVGYDDLSKTCKRCSYNYYRDSLDENEGLFFFVSECKPKEVSPLVFTKTVWISNVLCPDQSLCDGSSISPFDSVVKAFFSLSSEAKRFRSANLTFFLLGLEHYILIKHFSNVQYIASFFRNFNCEIKIAPWYCSMGNTVGCIDDNEKKKVKINLKTNEFFIFFSSLLTVSNIIFDARDIHIQKDYGAEECFNQEGVCCDDDRLLELCDDVCYLKGKQYEGHTELKSYGLFNSDFLFDDPESPVPELFILNCEFLNFYLTSEKNLGWFSLLNIFHFPSSIRLSNLQFENIFFEKGILFQFVPDLLANVPIANSDISKLPKNVRIENISIFLYNQFELTASNYKQLPIFQFDGSGQFVLEIELFLIKQLRNFNNNSTRFYIFMTKNMKKVSLNAVSVEEMGTHAFIFCETVPELIIKDLNFADSFLASFLADYYFLVSNSAQTSISTLAMHNIMFENIITVPKILYFLASNIIIEDLTVEGLNFFLMYIIESAINAKKCLLSNITQNYKLIFMKNSFLKFESLTIQELTTYYLNVIHISEENTVGNIVIFEDLLVQSCTFNFSDSPTKILNWPRAHSNDQFILNKLVFQGCFAEGYGEIRFIDWPYANSIQINNVGIYDSYSFMLVSLTDFAIMQISNIIVDGLSSDDYLFAISCLDCTLYIDNMSLANISMVYIDLFFISCFNAFLSHIYISPFYINSSFLNIFTLSIFNELYINNITVQLSNLIESPFPIQSICYVSSMIAIVSNCYFTADSESILSSSTAITFYYTSQTELRNITVENFKCRSSLVGNIFLEHGVIPFIGSDNYLDADYFFCANVVGLTFKYCTDCTNGVLGFLSIANISISNSSFFECSSKQGGAISARNAINTIITFVTFENTRAKFGGALFFYKVLYLECADLILKGISANYGGALSLQFTSDSIFYNCFIDSTRAQNEGGAFHSKESSIQYQGGQISNVFCDHDGGVFYTKLSKLVIKSGFIAKSPSAEIGGFLYAYECSFLFFEDITIETSKASTFGSAFIFFDCNTIEMTKTAIQSSEVLSGSGTIHIESQNKENYYNFSQITCRDNIALQGSCFSFVCNNNIIIEKSKMIQNMGRTINSLSPSATERGTLYLYEILMQDNNIGPPILVSEYLLYGEMSELYIDGLTIINNIFKNSLLFYSDCRSKLSNIIVTETKKVSLDSFYPALLEYHWANITLSNIKFMGKGLNEMSILYAYYVNLSIDNSFIEACMTTDAGCIYIERSICLIYKTNFSSCKGYRVGVLYSSFSNLTCIECEFVNNSLIRSTSNDSIVNNFYFNEGKQILIKNSKIYSAAGISTLAVNINSILILGSIFLGPEKHFSKALKIVSSNLSLEQSIFKGFDSNFGGCFEFDNKKGSSRITLAILKNNFRQCLSPVGGAFYLSGVFSNGSILENTFTENKAYASNEIKKEGKGGVGVFLCKECSTIYFSIKQNVFERNTADWFAATIFSQVKIDHLDLNGDESNLFDSNLASSEKSDELIYLPLNMIPGTINNSSLSNYELERLSYSEIANLLFQHKGAKTITSGTPNNYVVLISDSNLNPLIIDLPTRAIFEEVSDPSRNFTRLENRITHCSFGVCFFPNVLIYIQPNTTFFLKLRLEYTLYYLFPDALEESLTAPVLLQFYSRLCVKGELLVDSDQSCYKCLPGKYSFVEPKPESNQRCNDCPDNALCPGGDLILPAEGYWRADYESTLILECLSKKSCLGGNLTNPKTYLHGGCEEHHSGVLCYTCEKGYARLSAKDICKICERNVFLYFKIVAAIIVIFLYIAFQVNITFKANSNSNAGILVKQLVNHFQQVGMISLVDLGWTPDIKNYFAIQEYFSFISEELITIDCFVADMDYNILTQKIVFSNILPIMLSILTVIFWLFSYYFNTYLRRSRNAGFQRVYDQVRVSTMIIVYLLFPEILRKCFSLLNCIVIDNNLNTKVLMYSPSLVCWKKEHLSYIVIAVLPGLFIWGFLTPFFVLTLLKKYKKYIVYNIKSAKKIEKIKTQSIEALKMIDEVRQGRPVNTPFNKEKSEFTSQMSSKNLEAEITIGKLTASPTANGANSVLKRNNFFTRVNLQEYSGGGVTGEASFFKMNSLDFATRRESIEKVGQREKDQPNQPINIESIVEPHTNEQNSKETGLLEKLKRSSINILRKVLSPKPALTAKEQRQLRKENGLMLKFLYKGYAPKYYYWEIIMFSKKFFLIFIGSFNDFFPSNTKAIVLLILLSMYIYLQAKNAPFEKKSLNDIEFTSLVMSFLTANMGIMLFTEDLKKISGLFLILILIFNFGFIVIWGKYFFSDVLSKFGIRKFILSMLRFGTKSRKTGQESMN